jgi:hypothetical protein
MAARPLLRTLIAVPGAVALVAACAGAAPAEPRAAGSLSPEERDAVEAAKKGARVEDAGPPADAAPRCPYGELTDPHRGFIRCLLPDERDAGWLPPPGPSEPPKAEPPKAEPPKAEPPKVGPPPVVAIGAPTFENGQVTRVEKSLGKASADIARCVAEHGGLRGDAGSMKVQFLVRSRGRAEGVEILAAKGVSAEASACVRVLLKNKAIGAPSADPVGVTVVLSFKPGP